MSLAWVILLVSKIVLWWICWFQILFYGRFFVFSTIVLMSYCGFWVSNVVLWWIFVSYIFLCWIFFSFQFCSMVDFFVFEYCPKTPMLDFKFSILSFVGFFLFYIIICWILVSNIARRGIFWFLNNALWWIFGFQHCPQGDIFVSNVFHNMKGLVPNMWIVQSDNVFASILSRKI